MRDVVLGRFQLRWPCTDITVLEIPPVETGGLVGLLDPLKPYPMKLQMYLQECSTNVTKVTLGSRGHKG
jgi:hypothetical protein